MEGGLEGLRSRGREWECAIAVKRSVRSSRMKQINGMKVKDYVRDLCQEHSHPGVS